MSLLGPSLFSPIFLHRNPNFDVLVPNSDVFIYLLSIFWHISGNFSYYYAGIMLDAHASLLCSKLCRQWHNVDNPSRSLVVARWDTRSWGDREILGLSHLRSDHRICIGWLGNGRPKYAEIIEEIIAFLLDRWFNFCIFYYVFRNTVTRRLVLTLLL